MLACVRFSHCGCCETARTDHALTLLAGKKPVALVIAPTRELALQINAVLEEAGAQCGIRCASARLCREDAAELDP